MPRWDPVFVLRAGRDVEPALLDEVSGLGSGTRVIGVYEQRWSEPGGRLSAYLHGVGDPGNVGAIVRTAHALADGPVVLGPGCADPWSPKAVRASMGSIFARPPARGEPLGNRLALDPRARDGSLRDVAVEPPVVVCLGAEREGLPDGLGGDRGADSAREGGPDSLNVAAAAAIALYELRIGWPAMADAMISTRCAPEAEAAIAAAGSAQRARGAASALPRPQVGADAHAALDRGAAGGGARAGRQGGERGQAGARGAPRGPHERARRRRAGQRGWRRTGST